MHLFHKWLPWSDPYEEERFKSDIVWHTKISGSEYKVIVQFRTIRS